MQLMCLSTEEGNTKGLDIFDVAVVQFSSIVKVPQMGWNTIYNLESPLFEGILENEFMYLVHSFYAPKCKHTIAITNYEKEYSSALQKTTFMEYNFILKKAENSGNKFCQIF